MSASSKVGVWQPSLAGEVVLRKNQTALTNTREVCDRLQMILAGAGASEVFRSGGSVYFRGGMFRPVWSTNILLMFSVGVLHVEEAQDRFIVTYNASIVQALGLCVFMALFFGVCTRNVSTALWAFSWFFGGNYLLALFRLPRWLRRGLEGTEENARSRSHAH